jgi:hypothetical protein
MGYRLNIRCGRTLQGGLVRHVRREEGLGKGLYLYRSQLSHFSSCLIVLTFETPQFALLDAAHGALSEVWWPQLYWCTTLVHILAEIGEAGALHSGERLLRAALRVVEEGRRGGG